MKKKIWNRCFIGALCGLALHALITVLLSYLRGDGEYRIVPYYLIRVYGTELNAITAQYLCAMLLGGIWGGATLIYQETDWNLLMQTAVHALCCMAPSLGIAYIMQWMPHSMDGLWQYLRLFGVLYAVVWIVLYIGTRKRLKQINARLKYLEAE